MAEERVQRRLAAILAADVVGYSRLMGEDEEGTLARLNLLRSELLHPKVSEYGGRIVKTTGDGTLIEFPSAVDAVQHAVDVQQTLFQRNADLPEKERIEIRMGINLGDIIVEGEDIFGEGVNVAARLESLAEPGGICVSSIVHESVRSKLDVPFTDLGLKSLKNIAEPVRVFSVALIPVLSKSDETSRSDAIFRRPAVAVLPFENLSGDPEQEYFADGLTEDIITLLSMWRSFPVIARNSTFAYKGQSPDIREVGKALGARYVIEGSVRKAGNRVRVTAQLINADTGHHVWAERYDRDLEDIFELQDNLTQQIAATVTPELERTEHARAVETKPEDLGAWDYYQRGLALLNEFKPESMALARGKFDEALQLDPNYSRAHTGIVCSYVREMMNQIGQNREAICAKALAMGQRAVELDPSDSEAHHYLSVALIWVREHDQAIAESEKAIQLNPSNHNAYTAQGHQLALAGRPLEGIPYLEKGLRLSPQDSRVPLYYSFMARCQLVARNYEQAADWARRAVRMRPNVPDFQCLLAACLGHLGHPDQARAALDECERLRPAYYTQPEHWHPFKNRSDLEHVLDGLRKAGWEG